MKHTDCMLCGSGETEHLATFENDPYLARLSTRADRSVTYVICTRCGFVFTDPMLDASELDEMYSEKYRPSMPDEKFIQANLLFMSERYKWILRHLPSRENKEDARSSSFRESGALPVGKTILDIGCGSGTLLKIFRDNGWAAFGIEPTESYAVYGREKFGLDIKAAFYTKDSFPGHKFDVIVCLQVLEHVHDPGALLSAMRDNLAEDGRLIIGVPTLFRPLRPVHPQTLAAPHLYLFSENTLGRLLNSAGFQTENIDHTFKGLMTISRKNTTGGQEKQRRDDYAGVIKAFSEFTDETSLYNRNLRLLRAFNADICGSVEAAPLYTDELEMSFTGEENDGGYWNVVFREGGATSALYDRNPIALTQRFIETSLTAEKLEKIGSDGMVLMWGFGLGYLPLDVLKKIGRGHALLICERDVRLFKAAMRCIDLEPLLKDSRVKILLGENMPFDTQISMLSKKFMLSGRILTIRETASYRRADDFYKSLSARVPERLKVIRVNRSTIVNLGMKNMVNTLDNMHAAMTMPGVKSLQGLFKGIPAIIVSAGPSLEKNFSLLRKAKGQAVIIAADTVLRMLVPNGIIPDLVISADPQESTYRKFRDIPMDFDTYLVCHFINYPDIIRTFAGKKFIMGSQTMIARWLSGYYPDKGKIDHQAQSVAHMAFNLAQLMDAEPVIFIGQDLCYYDENKKHAGNLSKGSPWEGKEKKGFIDGTDILGNAVKTTTLFQSFKVLFDDAVKATKRLCINATEGGLGVQGTRIMPFSAALRMYCSGEPKDINHLISSAHKEEKILHRDELITKLDATAGELKEIINVSKKIVRDVDKAKRLIEEGKIGSKRYNELSDTLNRNTEKMRAKQVILSLLPEYMYELELYMSQQNIIDIDAIEDNHERFKKQVERAGIYYSKILKVAEPFEKGLRTFSKRVRTLKELEGALECSGAESGMTDAAAAALLKAAKGYKQLYCYEKAIDLLKRVLQHDPESSEARLHLGEIYYTVHHPVEALELLTPVAEKKPKYMNVKKLIEQCREKVQSWEQKAHDARVEVQDRAAYEQLLYEGEFYYKTGDMESAESRFRASIEEKPDFLPPYLDLVRLYESRGEYDACVEVFESALGRMEGDPVLYSELGFFSGRLGELDRAAEFLTAASGADPELLLPSGDFFLSKNSFDKAIPFYEQALLKNIGNANGTASKISFCYAEVFRQNTAGKA
ncbi:MAG: 6-hydroxymethylpterin diphosphokinase MptE-like protein [Thermodesulfovibrionales bacterium]